MIRTSPTSPKKPTVGKSLTVGNPIEKTPLDAPRPRQQDNYNEYHRLYKRQKRAEAKAAQVQRET